jgi:hypothetical protein
MKPTKQLTLSEMAAISLGDIEYQAGEPAAEKPANPQGDKRANYTNGGASGFQHPFPDLVAVPKPRKLGPSSQKQFLQSVQGFILSRPSE